MYVTICDLPWKTVNYSRWAYKGLATSELPTLHSRTFLSLFCSHILIQLYTCCGIHSVFATGIICCQTSFRAFSLLYIRTSRYIFALSVSTWVIRSRFLSHRINRKRSNRRSLTHQRLQAKQDFNRFFFLFYLGISRRFLMPMAIQSEILGIDYAFYHSRLLCQHRFHRDIR